MPFIVKENYNERYFLELRAMVAKYGDIYLTSDNVHYRDKKSAEIRVQDALDVRKIVKYVHINVDNCPANADELARLFDGASSDITPDEKERNDSFVSEEDIEKISDETKADSDVEKVYESPEVEVKKKRTRKSKK